MLLFKGGTCNVQRHTGYMHNRADPAALIIVHNDMGQLQKQVVLMTFSSVVILILRHSLPQGGWSDHTSEPSYQFNQISSIPDSRLQTSTSCKDLEPATGPAATPQEPMGPLSSNVNSTACWTKVLSSDLVQRQPPNFLEHCRSVGLRN